MLPIHQNAKSYPCIKLTLCDFLFEALEIEAEANRCSIQSEVTRRLLATFYNDIEYRVRAIELQHAKIISNSAAKYELHIGRNLIGLLTESAYADNHSLNTEILFRLLVSFTNAPEMELRNHCDTLIQSCVIDEAKERERTALLSMSDAYHLSQNEGQKNV